MSTRKWFVRLSAVLAGAAVLVALGGSLAAPAHVAVSQFGAALARISTCGFDVANRSGPGRRALCEAAAVVRL